MTKFVSLSFAKPYLFIITSQALLADAARQNHFCLRFLYDIYDSPHPATVRRVLDEPMAGSEHETTSSIHITVYSELQPGSTGVVHIGKMAMYPSLSGPTGNVEVAVKLAFSRSEKSRLKEEHSVYSHLHSRGVRGIPHDIGLFVDEEPLLGAEGPYALATSYAGVSLSRSKDASDSLKQVVNPVYISTDSNIICRNSLLATLRSIHGADILHGDIRLSNLCITPSGDTSIIDFSHATESDAEKEKDREIGELSHILGMDPPTKPVVKVVEKPVLRRSARIKELERRANVEP
jgi:serine/threonine protein kinase